MIVILINCSCNESSYHYQFACRYEEPIYEDNVNDPVHGDYIPDVLKKSLKPEENEASMNTNSESQDN